MTSDGAQELENGDLPFPYVSTNLLLASSTFSVPMDGWNCNCGRSRTASSSFRGQSFCLSDVRAVLRFRYHNRLDLKEYNYYKIQSIPGSRRLFRAILVGSRKAFLTHGRWVVPSQVQDDSKYSTSRVVRHRS